MQISVRFYEVEEQCQDDSWHDSLIEAHNSLNNVEERIIPTSNNSMILFPLRRTVPIFPGLQPEEIIDPFMRGPESEQRPCRRSSSIDSALSLGLVEDLISGRARWKPAITSSGRCPARLSSHSCCSDVERRRPAVNLNCREPVQNICGETLPNVLLPRWKESWSKIF